MTLTQLNAFVLVARLGSVTAAANALGVSEPAVSQALSALRQHLGDQLLTRGPGGMTLTAGGSRLLSSASQIVVLGAEAHAAVRAAQGAPEQLRVVATSTVAEFVIGPLMEAFTRRYPGSGSAYQKVGRRVGDWPVGASGAALWLENDGGGAIADAGIGLTAVGAEHFSAAAAEDFLRGCPATEENFAQAGQLAAEHCRPVSDQRGPADYKRHLAGELTIRALRAALSRALATPADGQGT